MLKNITTEQIQQHLKRAEKIFKSKYNFTFDSVLDLDYDFQKKWQECQKQALLYSQSKEN